MDYLTYTWWSMKTIKMWGFLWSSLRVKMSPQKIDWSINPTHADGYLQLFPPYILPLCNVYQYLNNCAFRVMQLYASLTASNIFSIRKLECNFFWLCVIVYIFALRLENCTLLCYNELKRYSLFNGNLSDLLCTVSTYVSYLS